MPRKVKFEKLLSPYHIGAVQTKNRMIKSAAQMCYYNDDYNDDSISETSKAFYETLAKGGVGLIVVESPAINYPIGMTAPRRFRIDDDKYISGYRRLTGAIHKYQCPVFLELYHAGPWHKTRFFGMQAVAASAFDRSDSPGWEVPRELIIPEIHALVEEFGIAAERAAKAGFDGIEINAAGSHLLSTFISRFWNRRNDDYGYASLENRARFVVEIIKEIKKRLGNDFPVSLLVNGAEYEADNCLTIEESQGLAPIFERAGADAIQVRVHHFKNRGTFSTEVLFYPERARQWPKELDGSRKGAGALIPLAAAIKKKVKIPVISVGRLDPVIGENAIRQGKIDFIAMTRRLLADPELPNKVASGKLEEIIPCIACLRCVDQIVFTEPVRCTVNPFLGRERENIIKKAEVKKRIIVAGGGPAGMEAARVLALRGHEVMLYEKETKLGGLLPVAALIKGNEETIILTKYFGRQLIKLGVKINLNIVISPRIIEELKPDVLILAGGGTPTLLEIPGIDNRNVVRAYHLHKKLKTALRYFSVAVLGQLTKIWMPVGKRVIIIGGTIHGCELAEFLVKRGRKITIVESSKSIGDGIVFDTKKRLFAWLESNGAVMMTEVKLIEINNKGIVAVNRDGEKITLEADTIIPVLPLSPNTELINALKDKVGSIYEIGDCRDPSLLLEAIADGSRIAHAI